MNEKDGPGRAAASRAPSGRRLRFPRGRSSVAACGSGPGAVTLGLPPPPPPRARPWGLPSALFPFPTSLAFHFGGFPPFLFAFAGRAGAAAACPVPPRPVKPPRRAAPWALPPAARGGRLPPPRAADRARPPLSHCPPPRRASRSSQRWRKQSRAGPGWGTPDPGGRPRSLGLARQPVRPRPPLPSRAQ